MEREDPLDIFGRFLMENLRDKAIYQLERLIHSKIKAPSSLSLQEELSKFTDDEINLIRKLFLDSIDSGIHDFLFAVQEVNDLEEEDINIIVNGENIAALSDGLQGELFTEEGWILQYSEYPDSE